VPSLIDRRAIGIPDTRIVSMSPDGRWLVAARPAMGFQGDDGELCVYDLETLEQRSCADLSGLDAAIRLDDVAWSPDGEHLALTEMAFVRYVDGDLWLMDAATGELTNLEDDGFRGRLPFASGGRPEGLVTVPANPAFSPDGTRIAYSRSLFRDGVPTGNEIATIPIAGGQPEQVTVVSADELGAAYFGLRWAPDASRLYVSVHHADRSDLTNGIWVVPLDGSRSRLLVGRFQPDSAGPAVLQVSSDGATLLVYDPMRFGDFSTTAGIYALVDAVHGTPSPIEPLDPSHPRGAYVGWAAISPDGRYLLTLDRTTDPDGQVWVREIGGDVEWPLVPEGIEWAGPIDRGIAPTWAPNGTVLLTGGGHFSEATLLTVAGGTDAGTTGPVPSPGASLAP
jgi:WD40 repeat protein